MKKHILFLLLFAFATKGYAQDDLKYNVVTTAVPILLVSPDSRAGAMGDVGVASTPDGNSSAWNPAKLAFLEDKEANMALSYTPWMSRLVPDIDLAYVNYLWVKSILPTTEATAWEPSTRTSFTLMLHTV